jgi:hypothetical protein
VENPQTTIDALLATVRGLQGTIVELRLEIEHLTTGTVLLLAKRVFDLTKQTADLQHRMSSLDGLPVFEPRHVIEQ